MPNYAVMSERRHSARQRTYKGGRINFGTAGLDCIIRNISETGACLEAESGYPIPDDFQLVIKPEFLIRNCHVAWRGNQKLGVQFTHR